MKIYTYQEEALRERLMQGYGVKFIKDELAPFELSSLHTTMIRIMGAATFYYQLPYALRGKLSGIKLDLCWAFGRCIYGAIKEQEGIFSTWSHVLEDHGYGEFTKKLWNYVQQNKNNPAPPYYLYSELASIVTPASA